LRERSDDIDDDDVPIEGQTPPNYTDLVVAPIARALANNRALKVLSLNGLDEIDPISFALLCGMLQTNVTLERIKFHDSIEHSEAKDKIEWLLTLNRYKRRCFPVVVPDGVGYPLPEGDPDPRPACDPEALPGGVWSSVLERIATDHRADVMSHFLRRLPNSLFMSSLPAQRRSGRGLKRAPPSNRSEAGVLDGSIGGIDGPGHDVMDRPDDGIDDPDEDIAGPNEDIVGPDNGIIDEPDDNTKSD
jgi:hypothetical protein